MQRLTLADVDYIMLMVLYLQVPRGSDCDAICTNSCKSERGDHHHHYTQHNHTPSHKNPHSIVAIISAIFTTFMIMLTTLIRGYIHLLLCGLTHLSPKVILVLTQTHKCKSLPPIPSIAASDEILGLQAASDSKLAHPF